MSAQSEEEHQRLKLQVIGGVILCLILEILLVVLLTRPDPRVSTFAGSGSGGGKGSGVAFGGNGAGDHNGTGATTRQGSGKQNTSSHTNQIAQDVSSTATTAEVVEQAEMQRTESETPKAAEAEVATNDPVKSKGVTGFTLNPIQQDAGGSSDPPVETPRGMFENRSVASRREMAEKEGGSPESEAAVERGLVWLANHQGAAGEWSLHTFHQLQDCNGSCASQGIPSDTAGTALGILPFLGAGYTHQSGKYRQVVESALTWLINDMNKDGSFRSIQAGTMYAQGQATIALCEAYAMTRDQKLRDPVTAAISYIGKSQDTGGGWRYAPNSPGDTSVTGWQVLALKSAGDAKLRIPREVIAGTNRFLDSVQSDKSGSGYGYIPNSGPTTVMTAEGLLCRMYSGWDREREGIKRGTQVLLNEMPRQHQSFYYWYYATQVMHHYGGDPWMKWNPEMRELLIETQATEGHQAGSWMPVGGHDISGGRIYATSLALLTLEVYYRHKRLYDNK